MARVNPDAQRQALIDDLKAVANKFKDQPITRNLYREHGTFSERLWQTYFPRFKDFREASGLDKAPNTEPETQEISEDKWSVSLPYTDISSIEELIAKYKVDTRLWKVDRFRLNKWDAPAGGGDKIAMNQVRADFVRRKGADDFYEEIELIKKEAPLWAPKPTPVAREQYFTGNMLEIAIPDLHLGKLAWSEETGYQNYDTKIAIETFYRAIEAIIQRTSHFQFDWILFPVGNDLLQADNQESETYSGTRVDTDSRYKKTFTKARTMIATAIERLRQIAPVKVVIVEGNHDRTSMFFLGEILKLQFTNYDDVTVDNDLPIRKYYEHGVNLIGYTHGDKGKLPDYPLTMAVEASAMWHGKKFREMHVGHKHTNKSDEFHGVRIRTFPALCPPDYWHASENFAGNLRSAVGIVWNDKEGPITEVSYHEDAYVAA